MADRAGMYCGVDEALSGEDEVGGLTDTGRRPALFVRNMNEFQNYKSLSCEEAVAWGKKYYNDWMPKMQNQEYKPETPCEKFFRYYTQGVDYVFNRILRYSSIDEYDFVNSGFSREMFYDSIAEINNHRLRENIVVYRYVNKALISDMKKWSKVSFIRKNTILTDRDILVLRFALIR